jgi:large subunit ribosomal protein L9
MPKVDVILTQNVVGLGGESDHVKVAPGYARNYLFPQRMAIPLTATNKRRLEVLKQRRGEREAHELNTMTELVKTLSKITLQITVKTGEDNKMFGSITAGSITDELKHQFDVTLDKKKVHLDKPIRSTGDFEVELRLHPQVTTSLKVHVLSASPQPKLGDLPGAESKETSESRSEARKEKGERRPRISKEPAAKA